MRRFTIGNAMTGKHVRGLKGQTMGTTADKKSGWVAALAVASGVAVIIPALAALAVSLLAVVAMFL